ncbi:MAG: putative methyltransferase, partial [Rickettsiaceae bacterium]|nr:putative methyltransferase [Rickettsiaceae bacterium]
MKHTSHEFLEIFTQSLSDNNFIKLSLSNFHGIEPDLKKIDIRKILIKKEEKLSFTYHYKTRDIVKNHSNEEGIQLIEKLLTNDFRGANLYTTEFDLRYDAISRTPKLHKSKPTQKAATLSHDREKDRLISNSKSYLHDLNITDEKGNVFKNAQDKYKQINKYVEILSGLIKNLPPEKLAKIVDMGSGKGYLTFALYDYMTNTMGLRPEVTGVEYRQDMVDLCNKIAKNSGFNSLHFEQGTIDKYDSIGTNILIALHACDTATDDAIAKGIKADADL